MADHFWDQVTEEASAVCRLNHSLSPALSLSFLYLSILYIASHCSRNRQLPHLAPLGSLGGKQPRLSSKCSPERRPLPKPLDWVISEAEPPALIKLSGTWSPGRQTGYHLMKAPTPARTPLNCSWLLLSSKILHNKKYFYFKQPRVGKVCYTRMDH